MACFVVPLSAGIITTVFRKKFPANWHIGWFNAMVFGGAAALAVEHVAHQEIVPWPPFLSAMGNPQDFAAMLGEMAAVGIPMAIALALAWAVLAVAYEKLAVPRMAKAAARGA